MASRTVMVCKNYCIRTPLKSNMTNALNIPDSFQAWSAIYGSIIVCKNCDIHIPLKSNMTNALNISDSFQVWSASYGNMIVCQNCGLHTPLKHDITNAINITDSVWSSIYGSMIVCMNCGIYTPLKSNILKSNITNTLNIPDSFQVWSSIYGNMSEMIYNSFEIAYELGLFTELKNTLREDLTILSPPPNSILKSFLYHPKILDMGHSGNTINFIVLSVYEISNSSFSKWYQTYENSNKKEKELYEESEKKRMKLEMKAKTITE